MRPRVLVGLGLGLGLTAVGCAHPQPANRPTAALYGDLERLVTVEAASGWEIDRKAIEELEGPALMSVCEATPARRDELRTWLDDEIEAQGGPVEVAWRRRGKRLAAVRELVELERIRKLLVRAMEAAPADCPFWVEPDDEFRGRQMSVDRWQVSLSGDSKLVLVRHAGSNDVEFGGSGRAVIGRTFGAASGLYVGAELGGNASFPRAADGGRGALELGVDLVTPVVYRYTFVNAYLEGEVGYLAHATEKALTDVASGFHVGVAIGGRATRRRWFFPGAALDVAYERTFPDAAQGPSLDVIKLGFRFAVDADW